MTITASLLLADKSAVNPVDGLHQLFLVEKDGRNTTVKITDDPSKYTEGCKILHEVDVTAEVDAIIDGREKSNFPVPGALPKKAAVIADIYLTGRQAPANTSIGPECKTCEFKTSKDSKLKSGFDECWVEAANIQAATSTSMIFDLWDFKKSDEAIRNKKFLLSDLEQSDLVGLKAKPGEISDRVARQLIQIGKVKTSDQEPWFNHEALKAEMSSWSWPLHFIDFETCIPAIPFKKGFSPYSEIAFQFSHHIMEKNGKISHVGEFINLQPGVFPSFDFLRELYRQLKIDSGTIFRYSSHENSVLSRIYRMLINSDEPDKDELLAFIKSITKVKPEKDPARIGWQGPRNMVDLLEIVKLTYYSPRMKGSNSLKAVLPAILNESKFLKEKYSKPIYGTEQISSKNFQNHQWIKFDGTNYSSDPYSELPPLFSEEELTTIEKSMSGDESIKNGGAAMMAYCKTQYSAMSGLERNAVEKSLLKYCELDTLAMVMLVEYFLYF